ncbi:Putative uncharacterized protein [Moritella viscosa]|nr:Putative uncharacterized protein [Moritella viscosa]SGY89039.1 Putative uncharacterized protein [Moritella viscosa]
MNCCDICIEVSFGFAVQPVMTLVNARAMVVLIRVFFILFTYLIVFMNAYIDKYRVDVMHIRDTYMTFL